MSEDAPELTAELTADGVAPSGQFSDAVLSGLERQHGWRFSDAVACRPGGGWALDRERVCTWLDDLTELPLVVVYVETGNGT